ncbi:MAG TPA: deaminase [Methanosarcina sp.]|nr:deaminase [Methanosarcina sp.]
MKQKWIKMYMDFAVRAAQESYAERLKVGAVFVSPDGVMSMGINGMPEGGTNECEIREYMDSDAGGWLSPDEVEMAWPYVEYNGEFQDQKRRYKLVTKDDCSHAEENLFAKLMLQGVSTKGGTMFITCSPCLPCAKIIRAAKISAVYYLEQYRKMDGIEYLRKHGIHVEQVQLT